MLAAAFARWSVRLGADAGDFRYVRPDVRGWPGGSKSVCAGSRGSVIPEFELESGEPLQFIAEVLGRNARTAAAISAAENYWRS